MAKCYTQKSRKEYVCSKCGRTIQCGEQYHRIVENFHKDRIRCNHCKPERSELTGSEYLQWLYDFQDHLDDRYDLESEDVKDEIYSEIENMKSDLEERLENIPEQLRDADAGYTLQERIDSLDEALSSLDSLDFPDKEEFADEDSHNEDPDWEGYDKDGYDQAVSEFGCEISGIVEGIC